MGKIAKIQIVVLLLLSLLAVTLIYNYWDYWFMRPESLIADELVVEQRVLDKAVNYKGYSVPCSVVTEKGELCVYDDVYTTWRVTDVRESAEEWEQRVQQETNIWTIEQGNGVSGEKVISYVKYYELMNDRVLPRIRLYIGNKESGIEIDNYLVWYYTVDIEREMYEELDSALYGNGFEELADEVMDVSGYSGTDTTFIGMNNVNSGYTDEHYFDIDEKSGFIMQYHGQYKEAPSVVIIPRVINGVNVKGIGPDAFYKYHKVNKIEAIVLPDSLRIIGDGAFKGLDMLKKVYIPLDIQYIGIDSFKGCSDLTSIRIPNSMEQIGAGAFKGCTGLNYVEIPQGIQLGQDVFEETTQIVRYTDG